MDNIARAFRGGRAWMAQHARWIVVLPIALFVGSQSIVGDSAARQAKLDSATCFLNAIQHPQANKIAAATVFIAALRSDGTLASEGTGFVVSDSEDDSGQGLRIVTAAHVVDDTALHDGEHLVVFFSDGAPVGVPHTMIRGETREVSVGGFDFIENDIAVIEIASFYQPSARIRFLSLRGLPLTSSDDILVGESFQPLGVSWGFSGAAAVDPAGRVVGVLTDADFRDRVQLELGSIIDANRSGTAVPQSVVLPARSLVVIQPLRSSDILRALGPSSRMSVGDLKTTVTLAGFPSASCAATSADVEPITSGAGTGLLSQWRSIGMEGAWYLPPSLGTGKLLPPVNTSKSAGSNL
jgi:hypothetical protein